MTGVNHTSAGSNELLSCPFCGGEPELSCGGPGNWWVRCKSCKAASDDRMRHAAIDAWNARVSGVAQAASMREALEPFAKYEMIAVGFNGCFSKEDLKDCTWVAGFKGPQPEFRHFDNARKALAAQPPAAPVETNSPEQDRESDCKTNPELTGHSPKERGERVLQCSSAGSDAVVLVGGDSPQMDRVFIGKGEYVRADEATKTIMDLQRNLSHWREECGKLHAKLDGLRAAPQRVVDPSAREAVARILAHKMPSLRMANDTPGNYAHSIADEIVAALIPDKKQSSRQPRIDGMVAAFTEVADYLQEQGAHAYADHIRRRGTSLSRPHQRGGE